MLVIDTSGSMGASGMATVRAASKSFLRAAPSDVLVGVTSFADTAGVDLGPTLDRGAVQRVVDGLTARGSTSLYAAMNAATIALGSTGDRSIVLLSDGADTVAPDGPNALAGTVDRLRAAGVRVDVVRFKTADPAAVTALTRFASANGGAVVPASDTAAVTAAFQASARALDQQVQFSVALPAGQHGTHRVDITGLADGTPFSFTRTVDFGAAPAPASQKPAAPVSSAGTPTSVANETDELLRSDVPRSYLPWFAAAPARLGGARAGYGHRLADAAHPARASGGCHRELCRGQ